jgi:hypothetical protein
MKTRTPAGYENVAPLQRHHRVLLPGEGQAPAAFARLHAIPLGLEEFAAASRDYPIAFMDEDGSGDFAAVAVVGMQARQNLFLLPDGLWDRRVYMPSYVRRYPFCMSRTAGSGEASRERVICVDSAALEDGGEPMFDAAGKALPHWGAIERMIIEFEAGLARSDDLAAQLDEMGLLEPFTMRAEVDGFTMQLEGMHRVNQEKLETLSDDYLRRILDAGVMDKVYAHLLSLDNFRRLLNRRSFFAIKPPADSRELN